MKMYHCILTIALFATIATATGDLRLPFRLPHVEELPTCTQSGFMCNGCAESWFCVPSGGGFIPEKIEDCPADTSCFEGSGRCESGFNPDCDNIEELFKCDQRGTFPDPYKCNVYHMCCGQDEIDLNHGTHTCEQGYRYNALNALCNKKAEATCTPLVDDCKSLGQIGPVTGHSNMYYICLRRTVNDEPVMYPQIYVCPRDEEFSNGTCRPPSITDNGIENGICLKEGYYLYVQDCTKYWYCPRVNAVAEVKPCQTGYRFDDSEKKCKAFTCN